MSKNESRRERKGQESQEDNQSNGINKAYYWIIGILFLVLVLLIVFIFSRSGDDVNLEGEDDQAALVEEETGTESTEETEQETEEDTASETDPAEVESDDTDSTDEATEETEDTNEEEGAETEPEEDTEEEDSTTVNENAPHDSGHATDYSEGSADRVEIKNRVMEATGLDDDLIEDWVGNDGPGRVVATVTSRDQSESYEVYLQYGDGSWHVTSVE